MPRFCALCRTHVICNYSTAPPRYYRRNWAAHITLVTDVVPHRKSVIKAFWPDGHRPVAQVFPSSPFSLPSSLFFVLHVPLHRTELYSHAHSARRQREKPHSSLRLSRGGRFTDPRFTVQMLSQRSRCLIFFYSAGAQAAVLILMTNSLSGSGTSFP